MAVIVLLFLVLPVALIWLAVAQPSLRRNRPSTRAVEPGRLREHVTNLCERFSPRTYADITNLNACAQYVSGHLAKAGARVSFQDFVVYRKTYRNVRGLFGPAGNGRIVVGAHYDCYTPPGADDNASGVAGLIELAYLLGQADLKREVELVAYTLEEPPFFRTKDMGSVRHAALLRKEGVDVRGVIVLEMIGCFSDERGSQLYPMPMLRLFYPSRGNYIGVVGPMKERRLTAAVKCRMKGSTDLPVYSLNAPSQVPGVDFSDHQSYRLAGYAAVMITDTAFYRNPRYHEPEDTPDTLDYGRMAKTVVALSEAVVGLAGK
jgi:Zn-dependent M28 family amino/carboxypeptidase